MQPNSKPRTGTIFVTNCKEPYTLRKRGTYCDLSWTIARLTNKRITGYNNSYEIVPSPQETSCNP